MLVKDKRPLSAQWNASIMVSFERVSFATKYFVLSNESLKLQNFRLPNLLKGRASSFDISSIESFLYKNEGKKQNSCVIVS